MNYWFSPANNAFYPVSLKESYVNAGSLPNDLIEVEDSVFSEFSATPPEGSCVALELMVFRSGLIFPLWKKAQNKSRHAPVLCGMNSPSVQIGCLFLISLLTIFH
ncbi:hypothetical protein STW0522ENT60_36280 [Enterobacter kobei]|nr:hypothetical protein STW0522ENT60_36280 [Enterobacter kobei]